MVFRCSVFTFDIQHILYVVFVWWSKHIGGQTVTAFHAGWNTHLFPCDSTQSETWPFREWHPMVTENCEISLWSVCYSAAISGAFNMLLKNAWQKTFWMSLCVCMVTSNLPVWVPCLCTISLKLQAYYYSFNPRQVMIYHGCPIVVRVSG